MGLLVGARTTPCGHSFCRGCLLAILDRRDAKCPLCRAPFHSGLRDLPVSKVLEQVIERLFPDEFQQLFAEEQSKREAQANGPKDIPLFVMSTVLPGEMMTLNIFEPRYRLLIRRAMEGQRRFGMAGAQRGEPLPIFTEVEIVWCETQPDGRYHIEVRGLQRFSYDKIEGREDYPGVQVAVGCLPYEDEEEEEEQNKEQIAVLARNLQLAVNYLCEMYRISPQLSRLASTRPSSEDVRATCWFAGMLATSMAGPAGDKIKYDILKERSLLKRLVAVLDFGPLKWATEQEESAEDH